MQGTFVNSVNGFFGTATGGGTSPAMDTTTAACVLLIISNISVATSWITDSAGNGWVKLNSTTNLNYWISAGKLQTSASHTFTVGGAPAAGQAIAFVAVALGGVAALDQESHAATSGTSVQPGAITPNLITGPGNVMISAVSANGVVTSFNVGSGFTIVGSKQFTAGNNGLAVGYFIPPGATTPTVNPTWSFGGTTVTAAGVTIFDIITSAYTPPPASPSFMNLVTRPGGPASTGYGYSGLMFGNVFAPVILYTITGNVQQPGTTVFYTGPSSGSAIAGAGGNYVITGLVPGNYIITPSLVGYSFAPTSQSVTISTFNQTGVNFTATYTGAIFSISGNAGAAGVTVSWTGTSSGSVSADGSGNYTIPNLTTGTYTVTPSSGSYTFTPPSQTVNVISSNLTGINFIATPVLVGHSISGNVGVAYATVGWEGPGGTHGGVTADSFGNYIIVGLGDGSYLLRPRLTGWSFTPKSRTVIVSGANVTGINWTALNLFQLPVTRDATAAPASGQIIPLSVSPNQTFTVNLTVDGNALTLNLGLRFSTMAGYWVLSIYDANNNIILDSLPMITGWYPAGNILAQYSYLKIGSAFILNEGTSDSDYPGSSDLGTGFQLLWADTA